MATATFLGPILGGFLALTGLFAGWILTEVSHMARRRESARSFLGEALADLLEIRHRLVRRSESIDELAGMLSQAFGEPPAKVRPLVGAMIDQFWPEFAYDAQLAQRYDMAVTKVASVDPILAFELRGKDWIMVMGPRMRAAAQQDATAQSMVEPFHALVMRQLIPTLDTSIGSLARQLGRGVERDVKAKLNAPAVVNPEMKEAILRMFQELAVGVSTTPNKPENQKRPRRRKR